MTDAKKLKEATRVMRSYERLIQWYNRKYNFEVPETCREYYSALKIWDELKAIRDNLKTV